MSRVWALRSGEGSVGRAGFVAEFGVWDAARRASAEQVEHDLEKVDLVRMVFCDPHGLARSKTLTADAFRRVLRNGMDFSPGPFLFDSGHAVAIDFLGADPDVGVDEIVGAGDFVVVPDPRTFQLLPGREPATAWVVGDEFLRDGRRHPLSSRDVLRRVCADYAAMELEPVVGLEVEWYLTRAVGGPAGNEGNGFGLQGSAPVVEALNGGYQFNLDSYYDTVAPVTDPMAAALAELGLPLRSMEHESGPGQVETTFDPLSALDAADAMLLFRTFAKQFCARRGHHASFMALPKLSSFDPSGWHVHQSVLNVKTGANLFPGAPGEIMSPHGEAYVRGLLERARDLCLLSVPTVNGYRRLRPEFSLSPTHADRRLEHRGAMVRVCGSGEAVHVENRIGEPSANPYLALAAQLSAGLAGVADEEASGRARPQDRLGLPQSLGESLTAFQGGSAGPGLLGVPFAACLGKLKASELARFEAWRRATETDATEVTDWEHREYFGVF